MLSKERRAASCAVVMLLALTGCSIRAPWRNEHRNEVNVAFSLDRNVVVLSADVEKQPRRLILATGTPHSILNGSGPPTPVQISFGARTRITLTPERLLLTGVADGILGADAWEGTTVTIDYAKKLLTIDLKQQTRSDARAFPFETVPVLPVTVDGHSFEAVVDTSSPDTLVLPGRSRRRTTGAVTVCGDAWGRLDYQEANVTSARIGNRLLARYLLTIDYSKRKTYIWKTSP